MPSTKIRNLVYRSVLPFRAPAADRDPVASFSGHPVSDMNGLARILRKHHVLGGAVLISSGDDEALVLSRCTQTAQTAQEDSIFRVASITKTATALLALRFCDEGLLDPNEPVSGTLPDADSLRDLRDVTLLHLLSHTSGLSDPPGLEGMLESGKTFHVAVTGSRFAEPGSAFRYSNLAFGLVGCILESVSGRPLGDLFEQSLFKPLGMNATLEGCHADQNRIMPVVRILPYRPDSALTLTKLGQVPLVSPDPLRHYGHTAGSMYTDVSSLKKMLSCIRDGGKPLLSASAASMMKQVHASYGPLSPTLSYGLGLLIIRDGSISDGRILGHQGFAYGCADGAFWDEDTGRIMIMLNGGCSEARDGRLGLCNRDMLRWAFRKELPRWTVSAV